MIRASSKNSHRGRRLLSLRGFSSFQTGFLATLSFAGRKCAAPSAKLFFMGAEEKRARGGGGGGEGVKRETAKTSSEKSLNGKPRYVM